MNPGESTVDRYDQVGKVTGDHTTTPEQHNKAPETPEGPSSHARSASIILQELQKEEQQLRELITIECNARDERRRYELTIDYCSQEYPKRVAKIQELIKEYQDLISKLENHPSKTVDSSAK